MGTPWGCPTTGVTPSERKHRVSSQGGSRAEGKMVSWLWSGCQPQQERERRGGGHPVKPHSLGYKKPKFTPQQGAVPGFELGVLPALVTAPRTPPVSSKGDTGTDGAGHCTTFPSVQ